MQNCTQLRTLNLLILLFKVAEELRRSHAAELGTARGEQAALERVLVELRGDLAAAHADHAELQRAVGEARPALALSNNVLSLAPLVREECLLSGRILRAAAQISGLLCAIPCNTLSTTFDLSCCALCTDTCRRRTYKSLSIQPRTDFGRVKQSVPYKLESWNG